MLNHISKTEGIISLYRSLPITLIMNVPQAAFFMTIYENLKSLLFSDGKISMLGYFGCAGLAGAISSGVTTPMDVIKTRLQTQREQSPLYFTQNSEAILKFSGCTKPECQAIEENGCKKPRYCTARGTVKLIYEEGGFSAFFRGVVPRMLFVLPGAAVSWSAYEYIKSLLV